jgi:hypothetical protein
MECGMGCGMEYGVGQGGFIKIFGGIISWLVNPPLRDLGMLAAALSTSPLPPLPPLLFLLPTPYSLLPHFHDLPKSSTNSRYNYRTD